MEEKLKQLLLKDLCARLPYFGLMVQYKGEDFNIIDIGFGRVTLVKPFMSFTSGSPLIEEIKPYLRPMSSMTEEEETIFEQLIKDVHYKARPSTALRLVDWLDKNMFDYRGLIEKGLALEAPKGMYNN